MAIADHIGQANEAARAILKEVMQTDFGQAFALPIETLYSSYNISRWHRDKQSGKKDWYLEQTSAKVQSAFVHQTLTEPQIALAVEIAKNYAFTKKGFSAKSKAEVILEVGCRLVDEGSHNVYITANRQVVKETHGSFDLVPLNIEDIWINGVAQKINEVTQPEHVEELSRLVTEAQKFSWSDLQTTR